jgi:hypothetical protein
MHFATLCYVQWILHNPNALKVLATKLDIVPRLRFKVSTWWQWYHLSQGRSGDMAQIWGIVLQWGDHKAPTCVTFDKFSPRKKDY